MEGMERETVFEELKNKFSKINEGYKSSESIIPMSCKHDKQK